MHLSVWGAPPSCGLYTESRSVSRGPRGLGVHTLLPPSDVRYVQARPQLQVMAAASSLRFRLLCMCRILRDVAPPRQPLRVLRVYWHRGVGAGVRLRGSAPGDDRVFRSEYRLFFAPARARTRTHARIHARSFRFLPTSPVPFKARRHFNGVLARGSQPVFLFWYFAINAALPVLPVTPTLTCLQAW
ncbi:hypothetical protein NDU88_004302 [Pleurodeles waltl]|uniref:Uncharacterized protein n=1 Tax=Pleurodeles waltl TaxID=8319 RepID=A0AAV7PEM5_PLEWA|nr:hypothetical protein NDU88_004302 [Pleurodeles waltl]